MKKRRDVSWRRNYNGKYRKKMRARDVVLTALLTALCVSSNLICSHTIPLHAGTAVVLLSGISLGPVTGFLVGAISRLICNFFDGQGPWTVWQMFSWGLLGIIAGMAFYKSSPIRRKGKSPQHGSRPNILLLSVFSFVVVFIVYGGVMNLAAMFMNHAISPGEYPLNRAGLIAVYTTGIPYDLAHACGTAICMFLFGDAFLEKIRRIQMKYGI